MKRKAAKPQKAVTIGLGDLKPDPRNARRHTPRNVGTLVDSLHKVGAARSIVIDENNVVLAGNATIDAAGQAGIERVKIVDADGETLVAVRRTGLSAKQKVELGILDNRTAELAEWDVPEIESLAKDFDLDLNALGFGDGELAEYDDRETPEIVEDEIPADVEPRCKAGELWTLGEHRLLCGDSTKAASWEALKIERPAIVFTSPPYGVGENAKLRDHYVPGAENRKTLYATHADSPDEWPELMRGWTSLALGMVDCIVCNVQALANNKRNLLAWANEYADNLVDAPQMQRNVLNNSFEWMFILSPKSDASRALPLGKFHGSESNVVRINAKGTNEFYKAHRATMPVELAAWAIRVVGAAAKFVVDPFGGTGTTMIAAQQLGLPSASIELDPTYCDIILTRWESLTGGTAKRADR